MHRALTGEIWLTASDLVDFLQCRRITWLEAGCLTGRVDPPPAGAEEALVAEVAADHERAVLRQLTATARAVCRVRESDAEAAEAATREAMARGVDVIYQGVLRVPPWYGRPDFLIRTDGSSLFGPWAYEVWDAKLARTARATAAVQATFYSQLLEIAQGTLPPVLRLALPAGEPVAYPVSHFYAYTAIARDRLQAVLAGGDAGAAPEPDPVAACETCRWLPRCRADREAGDHLALVADIRREQIRKLRDAGIRTVTELAALARQPEPLPRVRGMNPRVLDRLATQANLQKAPHPPDTPPPYRLLEVESGKGLANLPTPSPGDVFFDLEGDPFGEDGSLEYLWGWVEADSGRYGHLWAHDGDGERRAFETFVDMLTARLRRWPALHVYHYASYEAAALTRLAGRYGTREAEVDRLLRGGVLVDLYRIVRQALLVGTDSYSIKALEVYYRPVKRSGSVKDGTSSIHAYRRWRVGGDDVVLESIRAYNEDDCRSTADLRDWLEDLRLKAQVAERPQPRNGAPSEQMAERDERERVRAAELRAAHAKADDPEAAVRARLADLIAWHRREDRPAWQAFYRRLHLSEEELHDDPDVIAGLEPDGEHDGSPRFRFDPGQEYKLREGDRVWNPETGGMAGYIRLLDPVAGAVVLDLSASVEEPRHVMTGIPVDTTQLAQALDRVGSSLARSPIHQSPYQAAVSLLGRRPPGQPGVPMLQADEDPVQAGIRWAMALNGGCLAVQGPPGTGKTYLGGHVIAALIRSGKKVGITAQSHKVIGQLLEAVWKAWDDPAAPPAAVQKASPDQGRLLPGLHVVDDYRKAEQAFAAGRQLVAGTAWLFARSEWTGRLDVLVIDEAGQFSLADAVAVSTAARNLVLLGDPRQLRQVVQGHHPPGVAVSALEYWLGERSTMAPDAGLFLPVTRRLHPDIAAFISTTVYDGRLASAPECAGQRIVGPPPWDGAGLRWVPVAHRDNRTTAPEEIRVVRHIVDTLLGCRWIGPDGCERPVTTHDILVVAPFNSHVNRLERALPAGARVGTVDRFQGQEAAVVVYSMAASDADHLPHGLEFLYSLNRLNVAISRARALAILVASPALLEAAPADPERLRLVNALAAFVRQAKRVTL